MSASHLVQRKPIPTVPTPQSTRAQSKSSVAFAPDAHPYTRMMLDPEGAPPCAMPDQYPHPVFPFKTQYTADVDINASGYAALTIQPREANVLYTTTFTTTTSSVASTTAVANPDATDLESMAYLARLCCGAISVTYTGTTNEGAGRICAVRLAGAEAPTAGQDLTTYDYDYEGRLTDGLYLANFPVDAVGFTTTAASTFYLSHQAVLIFFAGCPVGKKASIKVTWNWELVPKTTTLYKGLGKIEPYDMIALAIACNCANREIVSKVDKSRWKARAIKMAQAASKLLASMASGGQGWAVARAALLAITSG